MTLSIADATAADAVKPKAEGSVKSANQYGSPMQVAIRTGLDVSSLINYENLYGRYASLRSSTVAVALTAYGIINFISKYLFIHIIFKY